MTYPTPAHHLLPPPPPERWAEPGRSLRLGAGTYTGRMTSVYVLIGAAIVFNTLTGVYMQWRIAAMMRGDFGLAGPPALEPYIGLVATACLFTGVLLVPTTGGRRTFAAILLLVVYLAAHIVFWVVRDEIAAGGGTTLDIGTLFTAQYAATTTSYLAAWLMVRQRSGLSYLLLLPLAAVAYGSSISDALTDDIGTWAPLVRDNFVVLWLAALAWLARAISARQQKAKLS